MSKADYYDVLGVSRDVDEKALKSAFRKMEWGHHCHYTVIGANIFGAVLGDQ